MVSVALIKSSAEEETDLNSYFNAGSLKNILTLPTTCRQSFARNVWADSLLLLLIVMV